MKSPFPGMDPYLERYWGDVHHSLVTYTADQLQPKLPGDLRARIDEREFFEFEEGERRGDERLSQGFVKIIDVGSSNRVVTVIEFLSPSNKVPGEGQNLYLEKQEEVYRVPLQERLPIIRVPLRETDQDVPLDLQVLIDQCYRNGRYDDLNYGDKLDPPLGPEDAAWADQVLHSQGRR